MIHKMLLSKSNLCYKGKNLKKEHIIISYYFKFLLIKEKKYFEVRIKVFIYIIYFLFINKININLKKSFLLII